MPNSAASFGSFRLSNIVVIPSLGCCRSYPYSRLLWQLTPIDWVAVMGGGDRPRNNLHLLLDHLAP
jgi:hypothetical protein